MKGPLNRMEGMIVTSERLSEKPDTLDELFEFDNKEIRRTPHARRITKVLRADPAETLLYAILCAVYDGITTRLELYSYFAAMFAMRLRRLVISPIDIDESIEHGLNESLLEESGGVLSVTDRGRYMLREGRRIIMHEGYWMKRFLTEQSVVIISGFTLIVLVILKLWIGSSIGSHALITDGLENLTDLIVVGIIALSLTYKRDRLGAIAIMLFMLFSGTTLGYNAFVSLYNTVMNVSPVLVEPSFWGYFVAVLSIGFNYMLIWYKTTVGRMTGNLALVSDAKEDTTHIRIAVGVIIGFIFAEFGLHVVDSIVALLISAVIILEGIEALREIVEAGNDLSVDTIHLAAADQYDDLITGWILTQLARGKKTPEELNERFMHGVSIGFRYFDVHAIIGFRDLESKGIWKHLQIAKRSGLIAEKDGLISITTNGLILYYKNRAEELTKVSKHFSKTTSKWAASAYAVFGWTAFILLMLFGQSAYEWLIAVLHALLPMV
jgi:Co/Zn/Cd efflux system component